MRCARPVGGKLLMVSLAAAAVLPALGCVGMLAQLNYVIRGHKAPAEFGGLEGKRVAVVCVPSSAAYAPDTTSAMLSQAVSAILRQKVKDIHLVHQSEIANWIDSTNWDHIDYRAVGKGVGAEMVLAIDLESFSLYDGATLYKGRASLTTSVYDMTNRGEEVFRRKTPGFAFPVNGGYHATDTTEAKFRGRFVVHLAQHVAKHFYAYDIKEDFAREPTLLTE